MAYETLLNGYDKDVWNTIGQNREGVYIRVCPLLGQKGCPYRTRTPVECLNCGKFQRDFGDFEGSLRRLYHYYESGASSRSSDGSRMSTTYDFEPSRAQDPSRIAPTAKHIDFSVDQGQFEIKIYNQKIKPQVDPLPIPPRSTYFG